MNNKKDIEKIESLEPRRAMGAGHVESDIEDIFEGIRLKLNEIIDAVNEMRNTRKE